jgi:hypothetical protein
MEQIQNRVYLNEQELRNMVISTVKECFINEGKFGDKFNKFGRKVRNAALGTAGAAATLYGVGKGLDNTFDYQDNLQQQAIEMNGCSREEAIQYCRDRQIPVTPKNIAAAKQFIDSVNNQTADDDDAIMFSESRRRRQLPISEARMSKIIRNSIHKVLNS